jgi:hypothetical protein
MSAARRSRNRIRKQEQPAAVRWLEAGGLEAGELEAGELEAGELEAGELEAGELEADQLEAGELEAGELEADESEADDSSQAGPAAVSHEWLGFPACAGPRQRTRSPAGAPAARTDRFSVAIVSQFLSVAVRWPTPVGVADASRRLGSRAASRLGTVLSARIVNRHRPTNAGQTRDSLKSLFLIRLPPIRLPSPLCPFVGSNWSAVPLWRSEGSVVRRIRWVLRLWCGRRRFQVAGFGGALRHTIRRGLRTRWAISVPRGLTPVSLGALRVFAVKWTRPKSSRSEQISTDNHPEQHSRNRTLL